MWHELLMFLGIRNEFDWAPPGLGPEVNHPYMPHPSLRCCEHCGGGSKHAIHREPYDPRRVAEILAMQLRHGPALPDPFPTHAKRHGYVEDFVPNPNVKDALKQIEHAEMSQKYEREY